MPFKSIIHDVKGELGSISRKGKSRSLRVVQDSLVCINAFKQSCWANMPYELLRDVLMRIEASEELERDYEGNCKNPRNLRQLDIPNIIEAGPRRIQCIMDAIPTSSSELEGVAPMQTEFLHSNLDTFPSLPFFRSKSTRTKSSQFGPLSSLRDGMLVLKNKAPRWHEQLQCWCLNFNGRVTVASVKNFQLVAFAENVVVRQEQQENVILQFGKVGNDVFTMDYQYPISAFQAFAICLSSFDTKIACE
ncbi:hypothetical protein Goarm_010937 [Gossypium armourianum]|uniref:Tubby C-terminal domain-containing protein n=1 Tax=Gossypium armourianum TaxID=34283 RepID=A0A7J9IWU0_9ROSI|nr:hypothetical protein [Gossypium armourianum]